MPPLPPGRKCPVCPSPLVTLQVLRGSRQLLGGLGLDAGYSRTQRLVEARRTHGAIHGQQLVEDFSGMADHGLREIEEAGVEYSGDERRADVLDHGAY